MSKLSRHRRLKIVAIILLDTLTLCSMVLMTGCIRYTPPASPCPIETLLIDETLIPKPLVGLGHSDPPDRYGIEFQETLFIYPQKYNGGKIRQTVYRTEDDWQAVRGYEEFVETYFYAGRGFHCKDEETVWESPSEIAFETLVADEWQLGCTMNCSTDPQVCQYIGRYGVYFVWYYAQMSDVVTYAEFENILEDIDTRMAQCLE